MWNKTNVILKVLEIYRSGHKIGDLTRGFPMEKAIGVQKQTQLKMLACVKMLINGWREKRTGILESLKEIFKYELGINSAYNP